ncbi:Peptidoglycan-binding Lysin subgroup protein [Rutstroemia sp. NJR-2017a BVV2]|nr:Peptidoglycan-binding Lysin subgroup protein [Rutstroemia sp. NJR-2017a BVV2]
MKLSPTTLLLFLTHLSSLALSTSTCDPSTLNTTTSLYAVTATDTIFSIAAATARGVCDIARANRMPDAQYIDVGFTLIIPAQTCTPDNNSCLLVAPAANSTSTCVAGGPHTYTTVRNDTLALIATKFNLATSVVAALPSAGNVSSIDEIITAGTIVKLPQCAPSTCTVMPYKFTYGTYKDLAEEFNTTVGQIFGFNTGYRFSDASDAAAPVLTMPMGCKVGAGNVTVIS